jgi:xylulokinase
MSAGEITVGIDIGTSSVKAIAADADGNVVRQSRVPHEFLVPTPRQFEHDAANAWRAGPQAALAALGDDIDVRAVSVAAMVPSLAAIGPGGVPVSRGLLYGDERGQGRSGNPMESGELVRFLEWLAREYPDAEGFWPAQAVANHALTGTPYLSTTAAAACYPLFDFTGWSEALLAGAGVSPEQMPRLVPSGSPAATVLGRGDCVLEGGTIDAMAEQIVAGADADDDVLVICGTTLIVWSVIPESAEAPGFYPIPHTTPGKFLVGGPSNSGGLFLNWAARLLAAGGPAVDPDNVPLWVPYPRGERSPINDPDRRAELRGLDLTHGPAALRRGAYEAAGFVARRAIDAAPGTHRRIVATGGGVRVEEWVQTLADCTGLVVDVVEVPEGGALGAAFLGRMALGLEGRIHEASRWARTARRVEPDPRWQPAVERRYEQWRETAR